MIRAADLSMTAEVESLGGRYFADGREVDLFEWCAASGLTAVRLRLWFDPRDQGGRSYQGGGNDLATTLALARRAHAAGLDLLLDLHYSDFWTDPKKQQLPKAWLGMSHAEVCAAVHRCTADVLAHCWTRARRRAGCRWATRSPTACSGRTARSRATTSRRAPSRGRTRWPGTASRTCCTPAWTPCRSRTAGSCTSTSAARATSTGGGSTKPPHATSTSTSSGCPTTRSGTAPWPTWART